MKAIRTAALVAGLVLSAAQLHAQTIYMGLRGGGAYPTGEFGQTGGGSTLLDAAKSGFGYGFDAGLQLGFVGMYAGFAHIDFSCESSTCNSDGKYLLRGAVAGLKLLVPHTTIIRPFAKGGVTFNQLEGGYKNGQLTELKTDHKPGYEIGAGLDVNILGLVTLSPEARYVGQNFRYKVPGVNTVGATPTQGVNYFTFDVGLSFRNSFGGRTR